MSLLAVNQTGHESGNEGFVMERTLPLLQDTPAVDAWSQWKATWRDVFIVDGQGRKRGVLNLTANDLAVVANRMTLKQLLLDARVP